MPREVTALLEELKLIVAPDRGGLGKVLRQLSGRPFVWAYLGQDIASFDQVSRSFEGKGTQLDTSHRFHQSAQDLRDQFLQYVYDLGRGQNSLFWWMTSLAYRSSYVSKTFHQTCYLKVALDLLGTWEGPGPLVVAVADIPVRNAMQRNLSREMNVSCRFIGRGRSSLLQGIRTAGSMVAHRAFFLIRETGRLILALRLIPSPDVPSEPTTLIISSLHSGNLGRSGDFHRAFFGDLASQLGRLGHHVAVVPIILRDVSFKVALQQIQNASTPMLVPHRYLRLGDLIWAAFSSMRKIPLREPLPPLGGMDISQLIKEDLRSHRVSNLAADGLLMGALVRRWANLGASVDRIIYKYENQPWERALCWEARNHMPAAQMVGYQHARTPRLYLNYYLAPGEAAEAPLPDRVVTVGEHTANLLSSDGYKPGRIKAGGALHIRGLGATLGPASKSPPSAGNASVLVACSYGREEASELANLAVRLFDEQDGVRVVIKCHPATPFQSLHRLTDGPLPNHVRVSEEPITDLIPMSSIMVYTGSMVCVLALAAELPVVHLRPQFDLDLDPLGAVPEVRIEAMGLEELRQKVGWLLQHREEYVSQHRQRWNQVADELYGPVTEETFHAFVN